MRGAVRDVIGHAPAAVGGEVAGAVVPQANVVEVLDAEGGFGGGSGVVEDAVGQGIGGEVEG